MTTEPNKKINLCKTHEEWYTSEDKKKILLIQPELNKPSGANVVNSWMIQALRDEYDITIMTRAAMDIPYVNSRCGTTLSTTDFKTLTPPAILQWLIGLIPDDPWQYQQYCLLMRWCKLIKHHFDILMTTCNECDFGSRGIQYIHYPYHREKYLNEPRSVKQDRFFPFLQRLLKYRLRPWRILSGFSYNRMKRNLTLVNSDWTRVVYKDTYGAECITIYPPIPGNFIDVPWEDRQNGFVCIGRIAGEKRYEAIIDILSNIRNHFPDIHLHIIGSKVNYDDDYFKMIHQKVGENSDWISLHENVSHKKLVDLVCQHKYGIHAMPNEHFGIAVGEMVRGGCIVFAPNNGGQVEIIGDESRLLYQSDEDAVEKIMHVLRHPREQVSLWNHLTSRKNLFTTEKFMERIREVVKDFDKIR